MGYNLTENNYIEEFHLDLSEFVNLEEFICSRNQFTSLDIINLKELLIGNIDGDRIQQGIYNQFHGSLRPLKELVKLESLSISNTDIESGIEFLPDSITNFRCLADKRSEAKVKKIYEQLEIYTISHIDGRYNLKAWKNNWKLVKKNEDLYYKNKQFEKLNLKIKFIELEKEGSSLHAKKRR
uniref:Uncharacterized protein n=1 Tax=Rhizophagus irregularis (strain DAOM 181602 / DAOM 197198 / MUCL 43194) TaxID=747089 RepID=U9SQ96_RHIID